MAAVVTAKTDTDAQACAMRRHFDLGNRGEAAALCQTLLSADPSFAEPYLVAGLMAKANGAIDKAEAFLRRALDLGCRDPLGLVALAGPDRSGSAPGVPVPSRTSRVPFGVWRPAASTDEAWCDLVRASPTTLRTISTWASTRRGPWWSASIVGTG